jgi:hypothetical protein
MLAGVQAQGRMALGVEIGKVVSSRSHLDYVCQVYQAGESAHPPDPADYAFGSFVGLSGGAIGIVADSLLQNPDFGAIGPRLNPGTAETRVFTPDLLDEQATLVTVLALGNLGEPHGVHGVPREVIPLHSPVVCLDDEAIARFHTDATGRLQLRYFPLIQSHGGPASASLLLAVLDRLEALWPPERARLGVLRQALNWQRTILPVRS